MDSNKWYWRTNLGNPNDYILGNNKSYQDARKKEWENDENSPILSLKSKKIHNDDMIN